jgi:hypothetical protein
MFKDYVAYGVDKLGKEWFYRPYKWKNPAVVTTGKLYADDNEGIPIIDLYDGLTSQSYGLTATLPFYASTQITQIKNKSFEFSDEGSVLNDRIQKDSNILN